MLEDIKVIAGKVAPPSVICLGASMLIFSVPKQTLLNWPIFGEFVMDNALKGVMIALIWFLIFSVWIAYKLCFPSYREKVYQEVIAIRNMVREIEAQKTSAGREDWQKWDDAFFNEHLTKADRASEWRALQPIVMAVRNLRLASFLDNKISSDENAIVGAYDDITQYTPKYLKKTIWAERK